MDNNDEPRDGGVVYPDGAKPKGDKIGEGVGSVSGVVTGAAIGSAAGPIGTVIGGIAGAVGGWWAGHAVAEATHKFTQDDDDYYREHFVNRTDRLADRGYDDVRPAYQLGHIAGMNPDYRGQSFDKIEPDLQRGWGNDLRARHGDLRRGGLQPQRVIEGVARGGRPIGKSQRVYERQLRHEPY